MARVHALPEVSVPAALVGPAVAVLGGFLKLLALEPLALLQVGQFALQPLDVGANLLHVEGERIAQAHLPRRHLQLGHLGGARHLGQGELVERAVYRGAELLIQPDLPVVQVEALAQLVRAPHLVGHRTLKDGCGERLGVLRVGPGVPQLLEGVGHALHLRQQVRRRVGRLVRRP